MEQSNVLNFAAYIHKRYAIENDGQTIFKKTTQLLLYFAQRESLIRYGKPLFDANFYARHFGPGLHEVHNAYADLSIYKIEPIPLTSQQMLVMNYIFAQYGEKEITSLSRLARGQTSYINARKGIDEYADSDELMLLSDIEFDAQQQAERRAALKAYEKEQQKISEIYEERLQNLKEIKLS